MSCDVGKATEGLKDQLSLHPHHSSFPNPSVALLTTQLILPLFRCFTYVIAHSPAHLSLLLRHRLFTYVTPASRPCISPMLITKFSQNIVADTDKNKALTDCHPCSSSFLSIVKSHPLKIPASVVEKVRADSCLKLFLIDCRDNIGVEKFCATLLQLHI